MSTVSQTRTHPVVGTLKPRLSLDRVPVSLISLAIGAVLWEIVGRVANVPFFPPLTEVLATLWEMIISGMIFGNLLVSLGNLALGFGVSLVTGVVIGTAMGRYRRVNAALGIYVYALLTAPSLVFAPIFFSIFGAGQAAIVAVIFMYSAFIMIINTASAVENVNPSLSEMGRSYGASEWQLVTRIILPAALPMMFAGIRLGMGRAVTGMINGEMFIAVTGLGRIVTQAGKSFDGAAVLAILIVIIVVALAAVALVQFVDNRLTSWVPSTSKGSR
jgi:NitT/TauT family transport system permease protein